MNSSDLRTAVLEVLDQGIDLLGALETEDYTTKVPSAFDSSIGSHFRHCLDHFETLLAGVNGPTVDYDARARDERVENDREFALERTQELREACQALSNECFDEQVSVRCKVSYSGSDSPIVSSTFGREAMYSVVHAIHHYALISVMCEILEIRTPAAFGVAPSTVQHKAAV